MTKIVSAVSILGLLALGFAFTPSDALAAKKHPTQRSAASVSQSANKRNYKSAYGQSYGSAGGVRSHVTTHRPSIWDRQAHGSGGL
jgi:hypothetical protein